MDLKTCLRSIPDFPTPGILFWDITPLLANADALSAAIDSLTEPFKDKKVDIVAAVEARGFIFGSAVAKALGAGFIPIRKKGKLPYETHAVSYGLEYGKDTIEVHTDAIEAGKNVLVVDDLLATGGTVAATCELIEKLGGNIVGLTFLIELAELAGRDKLKQYTINSVMTL